MLDAARARRRGRAEALRRRVEDDPQAPREVLAVAALAAAFANEPAETGADLARRALRASPRRIPTRPTCRRRGSRSPPSCWSGRSDTPRPPELLNAAVRECRAAGAGGNLATALTYRAWLALRRGDLRGAEVDARTGVEAADLPLPLLYRLIASGILVSALVERGEPDAAARGDGRRWRRGPRCPRWARRRCASPARLRMAQGRTEEALADYLAVGEVAARSGCARRASCRGGRRPPWRSSCSAIGRPRSAWPRRTWPWRGASARRAALGLALWAAGLATGGRRGEELLREAVDVLAGSEARVEHIRAQTDLGAHLRRANRRAEAREHLRAALDAAHRAGAGGPRDARRDRARATGARPRRVALSGLDSSRRASGAWPASPARG